MDARNVVWLLLLSLTAIAGADDWPQWNGPNRDGTAAADAPPLAFPESPRKVWSAEVGLGYAGPVVAGDRVFVTDYLKTSGAVNNLAGTRDTLTGRERVQCLDRATGAVLWSHDYDRPYSVSYPGGPRATPCVHDGRLYTLGSEGDLYCYDAESGAVRWSASFNEDFGAKTPFWGHAASPLVFEDSLICMVGGAGSLVVAFDLKTGGVKWKALSSEDNETGYCPPVIVRAKGDDGPPGVEQLIVWDPKVVHSLDPRTGAEYWRETVAPGYGMSILPPVTDGRLLFVSGESRTSAMFRLSAEEPAAELLWRGKPTTSLYLATSNAVFDGDTIYGADIGSGALVAFDAASGRRLWQSAVPTVNSDRGRGGAHGSAFLIKVGGDYLILGETGDAIHARLSRDGYEEVARFRAVEPTNQSMNRDVLWTYPAYAGGRLFVRNDRELACYEVSAAD